MTTRMLINARVPEEIRIAIVEGTVLENYQVEVAERGLTRGNIYRGTVISIQPSLNAAFIDYGAERHGFLPIQDVVAAAYHRQPKGSSRPRIDSVLERGQPIVVQVMREPEGTKGAALTTNLSLAGRYMVLTPYDDVQGVSRKVEDEEVRRRLKDQASKLDRPQGSGIIIRTNALGQNKAALNRDLNALLRLWKRILSEAKNGTQIRLLYSDQDLILRALRDHLDNSVHEVLTDAQDAYTQAQDYMRAFMPRTKTRLVKYTDRRPLFARYGLDPQIESIYGRRVELASGGSIVIDRTEALIAIDINSGRSTRASSQEETALNTNLEAAGEVARHLRLRDLGGLIVVDFIDMDKRGSRRKVEKTMKEAMKSDKARHSVGRISANGLLEINRQRVQQALLLRTHRSCPTCTGSGRIASPELVGLRLLRQIDAHAADGFKGTVRIELHPELADAFQNSRRTELASLEREFALRIEVIASPRLHRSQEHITWEAVTESPKPATTTKGPEPLTIRDSATREQRVRQPASSSQAPERPDKKPQSSSSSRSRRRPRRGRTSQKTEQAATRETSTNPIPSTTPAEARTTPERTSDTERKNETRSRPRRQSRPRRPLKPKPATEQPAEDKPLSVD